MLKQVRDRQMTPDELDQSENYQIDRELEQIFDQPLTSQWLQPTIAAIVIPIHESLMDEPPDLPPVDNNTPTNVPSMLSQYQTQDHVTRQALRQGDVDHVHFMTNLHCLDHQCYLSLERYVILLIRIVRHIVHFPGSVRSQQRINFTFTPQNSSIIYDLDIFGQMHIAVVWLLYSMLWRLHHWLATSDSDTTMDEAGHKHEPRCLDQARRALTLARLVRNIQLKHPLPRFPRFLWESDHYFIYLMLQLEALCLDVMTVVRFHLVVDTRYWLTLPSVLHSAISPANPVAAGGTVLQLHHLVNGRPKELAPLLGQLKCIVNRYSEVQSHQSTLESKFQSLPLEGKLQWDTNARWLSLLQAQRRCSVNTAVMFTCASLFAMKSYHHDTRKCISTIAEQVEGWFDIQKSLIPVKPSPSWWQMRLREWGWRIWEPVVTDDWFWERWQWKADESWLRPWRWFKREPSRLSDRCIDQYGRCTDASCWLTMDQIQNLLVLTQQWTNELESQQWSEPSRLTQLTTDNALHEVSRVFNQPIASMTYRFSHKKLYQQVTQTPLHFSTVESSTTLRC
jgi:hypothetical protein